MTFVSFRWLILTAALTSCLLANSNGAPAGLAGAPGQGDCSGCHGSGSVNPAGGSLTIAVVGGTNYVPGQPLRLRVTLADNTSTRWGFQLTARRGDANTQTLGTFTSVSSQTATPQSTTIGHNANGTQSGAPSPVSWEVQWNPPANDQGPVIFYAAGNAANGNGSSDAGDKVYTANLQVAPQSTTTPTGNRVMPQFVFGSTGGVGFVSSLIFSNTGSAAAEVKVNFFGDDGNPMNVNGNASQSLNLAAKGTAQIQATDAGALTQGWALVDLPDGVVASGIFRQRVPGKDQEAAVLLSRSNSTEARFTYDQTGPYNTGMSMVNPTASAAEAVIRIHDEAGAVVQTITRNIPARGKVSLSFRTDAASSNGKRGLAEVEVNGAAIAVLALRFDDSGAFTSIPGEE